VIKSGFFFSAPNYRSLNAVLELNLDSVFIPFHEAGVANLDKIRKSKPDIKINVEVPVFAGKELFFPAKPDTRGSPMIWKLAPARHQ